jgi:hypothetical protein
MRRPTRAQQRELERGRRALMLGWNTGSDEIIDGALMALTKVLNEIGYGVEGVEKWKTMNMRMQYVRRQKSCAKRSKRRATPD